MKELLDKEVIIIDGEEYVKVLNPKLDAETSHSPYLYVPVKEYLARREILTASSHSWPTDPRADEPTSFRQKRPASPQEEILLMASSSQASHRVKPKVVLAYFDDQSTQGDETYGDWVAETLAKEVTERSQRILFVDYQLVKDFLKKEGYISSDLESPEVLRLLNQTLGIHALILGHLFGPYVFTTQMMKGREETAKALLKVEARIVEVLSGKTLRTLSLTNPIIATREKGAFSEEKAKVRAIELTVRDLGKALSRELDGLDWFCRVARIEGEEIYINAGRLSGLKLGDVMEVFRSSDRDRRSERKGKIQISGFFGTDASMGRLIEGKKPDVNDILRLAKDKGT